MQVAKIIYLTQDSNLSEQFDEQICLQKLGLSPKWTVFSSGRDDFYDLQEALCVLITRGARSVEAFRASYSENDGLRLQTPGMRVFG